MNIKIFIGKDEVKLVTRLIGKFTEKDVKIKDSHSEDKMFGSIDYVYQENVGISTNIFLKFGFVEDVADLLNDVSMGIRSVIKLFKERYLKLHKWRDDNSDRFKVLAIDFHNKNNAKFVGVFKYQDPNETVGKSPFEYRLIDLLKEDISSNQNFIESRFYYFNDDGFEEITSLSKISALLEKERTPIVVETEEIKEQPPAVPHDIENLNVTNPES